HNPITASSHQPGTHRWDPLSAAALAGGQSRRMGTDKALLPVGEDGRPMLALVLEQLQTVATDLMVVANDRKRYEPFGARVVPDVHVDVGTLGGVHAAISQAAHEYCLVVACDMPLLNAALLARMASEPRDYDVLVPVLPGQSRQGGEGFVFQTLHAIYSKRCLPAIERRIAAGNRQVIGFFDTVRIRTIDEAEIRKFDPTLQSFFNANTPEALAEARHLVRVEGTKAR
ncbi:MAG: molybdenum cofactor guanylyltransferase, partial [Thermomicrobiales bacterium]